jgi:putative transposase
VKYAWIREQSRFHSVRLLCNTLNVSCSGFYAWRDRPPSKRTHENQALSEQMLVVHQDMREAYGSQRLWRELRDRGIACVRHRVRRLRRQMGLITQRRRRYLRSRGTYQRDAVPPRLITWPFQSLRRDTMWSVDITYIPTRQGWLYLAAVLDIYSRKIVGWAMSHKADQGLASDALKMAITQRKPSVGLIHHSDQGVQYTSKAYQQQLKDKGMLASMSRKGMPYDNAMIESFFSSLKQELTHHEKFKTLDEARYKIFSYIEVFYNRQRKHSSLGYRSPEQFEKLESVA